MRGTPGHSIRNKEAGTGLYIIYVAAECMFSLSQASFTAAGRRPRPDPARRYIVAHKTEPLEVDRGAAASETRQLLARSGFLLLLLPARAALERLRRSCRRHRRRLRRRLRLGRGSCGLDCLDKGSAFLEQRVARLEMIFQVLKAERQGRHQGPAGRVPVSSTCSRSVLAFAHAANWVLHSDRPLRSSGWSTPSFWALSRTACAPAVAARPQP